MEDDFERERARELNEYERAYKRASFQRYVDAYNFVIDFLVCTPVFLIAYGASMGIRKTLNEAVALFSELVGWSS